MLDPYDKNGHLCDIDGTRALARALADTLAPGDFLALWGDMGAGKTEFVRALAQGLGVKTPVWSPSFVILTAHEGNPPLYHFDAYRVRSEGEMLDLGFDEFAFGQGVTALEWPQRVERLLPASRIDVRIERRDEALRHIRIERVQKGDR